MRLPEITATGVDHPTTSAAYVRFFQDWDFVGAEREFRRSLQLNSNFATAHQWYAEMLSILGRHDDALAEIRRAEELDPFAAIIHRRASAATSGTSSSRST